MLPQPEIMGYRAFKSEEYHTANRYMRLLRSSGIVSAIECIEPVYKPRYYMVCYYVMDIPGVHRYFWYGYKDALDFYRSLKAMGMRAGIEFDSDKFCISVRYGSGWNNYLDLIDGEIQVAR